MFNILPIISSLNTWHALDWNVHHSSVLSVCADDWSYIWGKAADFVFVNSLLQACVRTSWCNVYSQLQCMTCTLAFIFPSSSCLLLVAHPAAQGSSSSCKKSKTLKTEDTSDSNPSSSSTLKPPATLKASLPSPLKASLPAPMSVAATTPGPGPSSAPTLLHASARASTLQEHTATGDSRSGRVVNLRLELT